MSLPAVLDPFDIYAGDSFVKNIRFSQDGSAVDLSSWSDWRATLENKSDSAIKEEFTVDDSLKSQGVLILTLTPEQTRKLSGKWSWDLQGQSGDFTRTWVRGSTKWTDDVTSGGD